MHSRCFAVLGSRSRSWLALCGAWSRGTSSKSETEDYRSQHWQATADQLKASKPHQRPQLSRRTSFRAPVLQDCSIQPSFLWRRPYAENQRKGSWELQEADWSQQSSHREAQRKAEKCKPSGCKWCYRWTNQLGDKVRYVDRTQS